MTKSQRLAVTISETRQALNGQLAERNKLPEADEPSEEMIAKIDQLTRKLNSLEVEYRAQLVTEDDDETRERNADPAPEPQERELRSLMARSSLVPFLMEAVADRTLDGVEHECRQAVLGDHAESGTVPLDLLLPVDVLEQRAGSLEVRADAVTPVASAALADGSQASVLERVFTRTVAARLGVAMPSVPVGAANYPIMTAGTTAKNGGRQCTSRCRSGNAHGSHAGTDPADGRVSVPHPPDSATPKLRVDPPS